jgi:hypothetical protein
VAQLAGEIEGGTPIASMAVDLATAPGLATVGQRQTLFAGARTLARDTAWFDLGVWAEGSRLSLRNERASEITSGHHVATQLERVVDELGRLPEAERSAMATTIGRLERLRAELERAGVATSRLASAVDSTLVEGAR